MTSKYARRRLGLIIDYEPSWFAEGMSASGIFLWALAAFQTDDFNIHGSAWALPCIGLLMGPVRFWLLFHLEPLYRVLAAAFGFVWWAWLSWSLFRKLGWVPAHGAFVGMMLGDLVTVAKFSRAAMKLRRYPVQT